jgi:alpha-glucosidase
MPWTSEGPAAGFSTSAETWLPVDPAHRPLAAALQESDPGSTLHFTRRLTALRRTWRSLREGDAVVRDTPADVLGFERQFGEERLLCLFDLGGSGATVPVEPEAELLAGFSGGTRRPQHPVELPAWGGAVLRLAGSNG